jgi:hypothetical protein
MILETGLNTFGELENLAIEKCFLAVFGERR